MRIAGGDWRGRTLKVPDGDAVRPTQDRVREALFSMIQFELAGVSFLDLFAGSGGVGLEALSRGAARATFVELAPRHVACLKANVAALKAEARCRVQTADVFSWLAALPARAAAADDAFGIVYADPPYDLGRERGFASILQTLAEKNAVKPSGLFIAEMRVHQAPDESPFWELCRDRTYGQTRLAIYRRT